MESNDGAQLSNQAVNPPTPQNSKPPKKHTVLLVVGLLLVATAICAGIWLTASTKEEQATNTSTGVVEKGWIIADGKASVPRTEVSGALYNAQVFVVGGFNEAGQPVNTVELYDPQTDAWSEGPALPIAVHHTGAATLGDQLYVVGGFTGTDFKPTDKVYVYNGTAWVEGPKLPQPLGAQGIAVWGDRLFVVGGNQANGASTGVMYSLGVGDTEWQIEPSMPTLRNHLTLAAANDKLYAIGGRDENSMTLQTVEIYDPVTKKWQTGADMPTGRSGITSAVVGGKVYVFGGESTDKTFNEAEEYNPVSDTWGKLTPMPEARHGLGSAVFSNNIYLFLGGPQPGLTVSDTVQILSFSGE